jgi:CRISPR-associated protein (TIGR02710 family)
MEEILTEGSEAGPVAVVCTVGGSPAPIRSMLAALRPNAIAFIVSSSEGATQSSRSQVEDGVLEDGGPGLRCSPGAPGDVHSVRIIEVPLDDPDAIYRRCLDTIDWIRQRAPEARFVADYTGGTKSMSSGLLLAALSRSWVDIQFMAGDRSDLIRVADGSEHPRIIGSARIHADRTIAAAEEAIAGWDYAAAARILRDLRKPGSGLARAQRRLVEAMVDWCETLALWDAFRHREAYRSFRDREVVLPAKAAASLAALAAADTRPSFALSEDLWLNALRRAETGRYDDALARLYRVTESALQARVFVKFAKTTDSIRFEELPPKLQARRSPEAFGLGLADTARYLREMDADDAFAGAFFSEAVDEAPKWLARRNHSILAHGFSATRAEDWCSARDWIASRLRPLWTTDTSLIAEQLPYAFSERR